MAQAQREPNSIRERVRIYVVPTWAEVCGHAIAPERCRAEVLRRNGRWQCTMPWKTMVPGRAVPKWRLCGHHAAIAITRGIEEPEGAR